jgi:hypothetical protein
VELFVPTADVIKSLEGEKYVTQSLILLQLCALEKANKIVGEKCMICFFILIVSNTE